MSYTNGIGSAQQISGATEASAATSTHKVAPAGPSSTRVQKNPGDLGGTDEAKLSTTATVIAQVFLGNDVRTTRIAALQQSIAAGTYSVPSSDVADKLINVLTH